MLHILLTYDYELFMGKNLASAEEILFAPTEQLAHMMTEQGVRGTFFADTCSVLAHQTAGLHAYADRFTEQLQALTAAGHDPQLHIHAAWLRAPLVGGELCPGIEGYRLHEFGFDPSSDGSAVSIVRNSIHYLESTCRSVRPDYRCVAFRAGGFCLQPEEELIRTLCDAGILFDSSVVPHMHTDAANAYDYSHVPSSLNWRIHPRTGVSVASPETEGVLWEIPVATVKPRLHEYIGMSKSKLGLPPAPMKGEYVQSKEAPPRRPSKVSALCHRLFDYRYISMDTRYYERVVDDLHYLYRKHHASWQDVYVCLIGHPKLFDRVRIDNIQRLIDSIQTRSERFDFVTFTDLANDLATKGNH